MTLDEKRATRPKTPTTGAELWDWLEWHNKHENIYAWDFDFCFSYNGHIVQNSSLLGHINIDGVQHRISNFLYSDKDIKPIYKKLIKK